MTGWKHYLLLGAIAVVAYTIANRISVTSKLVNNGLDYSSNQNS